MAGPVGNAPPAKFNAGETVKYTRQFTNYPVSGGWSLMLYIAGASSFSVSATPSGANFAVTIPAAKTATVSISTGTGGTTINSPIVTRQAGDFVADGVMPGYLVHGKGISTGAYVKTVDSATQVTLSEPATATGTALALAFRFPPGVYTWQERATLSGEAYIADSGTMVIDPDLAGVPAGAIQSWEARMLPLVEDVIEGRIPADAAAYQIGDRAKTLVDMEDWIAFRRELLAKVASQSNPGKVQSMLATFTGAGFDR